MLSIHAVRGLPHLHAPGIVPCIISFFRQLPVSSWCDHSMLASLLWAGCMMGGAYNWASAKCECGLEWSFSELYSAKYWIHFTVRFGGVHAFCYNAAESEPIWMKSGVLLSQISQNLNTTRRLVSQWKFLEHNFEHFIVRGRFSKNKCKNFFKKFNVLRLQAAITPQWLQIDGNSLPKLPSTGCLVSIFTIGINSKSFLWHVRSVRETSPNSLRHPTPRHEWQDMPCHNVDGLSGRGLMTLEYNQNGDKLNGDMPKRRQTVNDVTSHALSRILYCGHSTQYSHIVMIIFYHLYCMFASGWSRRR